MMERLMPQLRFRNEYGNDYPDWRKVSMKKISTVNQGLQIPIADRLTKPQINSHFYITNEFLKENSKAKYYINNPSESVLCNENDVLMTRTGNTGKVVTGVKGAFHNNFFKIDYDKKIINRYFLVSALTSKKMQSNILIAAGQSTIPDLNHSDFYKLKISIPSLPEQQKIATFLSTLDSRIELQERKVENLEREKKGIMQKIFKQEIRFKDDEGKEYGEWDEKKLGDLGVFYTGLRGKNKTHFSHGNKPYIQYLNILNNTTISDDFSDFEYVFIEEKENQSVVNYGDLLFTQSSETIEEIGLSSVYLGSKEIFLNSFSFGIKFNDLKNISPEYIAYLFRSNDIRRKIIREGQGSTRMNLSHNRIDNMKIPLPTLSEQQKIANFLSSLDSKIEKEKEKLELIREKKKGLMQKMFI